MTGQCPHTGAISALQQPTSHNRLSAEDPLGVMKETEIVSDMLPARIVVIFT